MPGRCIKDAPPTILCFGPSCHGCRIVQDRPGRLKLGSLVLPPALCKTRPRALKSDAYIRCCGAPKLTFLTHFCHAAISWPMRSMCHKPAQFVGNGRFLNLFFGSGRTAHWLPRYGLFKFGVLGMCMYVTVHVCVLSLCRYMHICVCIYRYVKLCVGLWRYVPGDMWYIFHHISYLDSLDG